MGACGAPRPRPTVDAGQLEDGGLAPLLEVGTGTTGFVPLVDGQDLDIIAGPQGGFHLWTALRASKALSPDLFEVKLSVLQGGSQLSENGYRLTLVDNGAHYEWYGMQGLVPDPAAVDGQSVTLRIAATDSTGVTATDERRVVARRH